MATPTPNVNIGNSASTSHEELSSTASMSADSIPSNISDISTDSERQMLPSSAFRSAMDLTTDLSGPPARHLDSTVTQQGQSSPASSADQGRAGGTSQQELQERMPRREEDSSIRNMLSEFSSKIESSQRTLAESLTDKMRELTDVLTPLKVSIDEANRKIDVIERDHGAKIVANTNQIVDTQAKLQNAEIRIQQLQKQLSEHRPHTSNSINPGIIGRMNNIVISGIKEDQGEDIKAKIEQLASDLNCELSNFKARRLGKIKEDSTKHRQILLELSSNWEKRKLYAARTKLKNHSNTSLKSVFFNEDLDKSSSELYYKARQAKKQAKIKSVWTFGCQVYFTKLGSEQPISLNLASQLPLLNNGNVPAEISDRRDRFTTPSNGSLRALPGDRASPGVTNETNETPAVSNETGAN